MKVLHIIWSVNPAFGGPPRSVCGLCRFLADSGCETYLFVNDPKHKVDDPGKCKVCYGRGLGIVKSFIDARRILKCVKPDIVHLHNLWLPSNHAMVWWCRRLNIPYVIAPRGTLSTWALTWNRWKKYKKMLGMALYQRKDLQLAAAVHVTAEDEAEDCRRVGITNQMIISPNGVNVPNVLPQKAQNTQGVRRVLFMSRIHPKKGLLELVRAWAKASHKGWVLQIAGSDADGYKSRIEEEVYNCGVADSVEFIGFFNDNDKWQVYRNADLFVLPTHSENFGIVIAEALYAEVPVITTKGTPWSDLISHKCGWWIDLTETALVETLNNAMMVDDSVREEMGRRGRSLIDDKYTWSAVASGLMVEYKNIIGK